MNEERIERKTRVVRKLTNEALLQSYDDIFDECGTADDELIEYRQIMRDEILRRMGENS